MSTQSETVTVRLDSETKSRLEELAQHTRRTKSFLAAEAIADYVERELAIISGIQHGLDDVKAGRTVPHEVARKRIMNTLARKQ
ncbi:CopG family ribbon-helix-helix protein [Aminobacter sp. AP02]|uniref:CopG family ribbon-helix-helix protein n=1 Tax=Aminobacter sp. AP02 TaxID=2135737 RepID=UPI000D6D2179|nr:CopG family ribbon-helix-helix protein [Aminobacter sp. AP02]PWK76340.1 putative transcriptional regulator [Aminobacter sp. AP02]